MATIDGGKAVATQPKTWRMSFEWAGAVSRNPWTAKMTCGSKCRIGFQRQELCHDLNGKATEAVHTFFCRSKFGKELKHLMKIWEDFGWFGVPPILGHLHIWRRISCSGPSFPRPSARHLLGCCPCQSSTADPKASNHPTTPQPASGRF